MKAALKGKVDVARLLLGEGKANVEAKDNAVSAARNRECCRNSNLASRLVK